MARWLAVYTLPPYRTACGNLRLWRESDTQALNARLSRSQRPFGMSDPPSSPGIPRLEPWGGSIGQLHHPEKLHDCRCERRIGDGAQMIAGDEAELRMRDG